MKSTEKLIKERIKEYQRLINRINKIEADFNSEFKAFLGEDK